ncbi:transglutaminase-like cysteine peptidase [Caulobacter sp. 17J80-11]|uniref:transglutaminase-like cysteine peptidase n=1 Tax=Caulobacter sp. 17J80-11 TaxID=2763502 RepID=UPI001653AC2C|nr:transglutaminase-like cysteine peptidase [Caulobacter sp. 17J80-11]MBC6982491.1 transglutaminase-like cysteine peptidase [Caulobacter sp. 17J80-11]
MVAKLCSKQVRRGAPFGAVLLALALSACATTQGPDSAARKAGLPAASTSMTLGAKVTAPDGFLNLCMRSPTDCAVEDSFPERVRVIAEARDLSRQRWRALFSPRFAVLAGESPAAATPVVFAELADTRPASIGLASFGLKAVDTAPLIAPAEPLAPAMPAPEPAAEAGPAMALDPGVWSVLKAVNREINRKIHKASDKDAFGVEDWWAAPLSQGLKPKGDCEDYVLEKRRALIARGVPAASLSIALVRTSWGEPHAVLLASTDHGDYVLDNLSAEVKPWREVDYAWTARQSPTDLLTWVSLETAI